MAEDNNALSLEPREEQQASSPAVSNSEGEKSVLDEIKQATEELKKANAEKDRLLKKEKELLDRRQVERDLGGDSRAGITPAEKKEETPKEYKDRIMRGG